MSLILTLNAGSSSLKFALYEAKAEPVQLLTGQVENIGAAASLQVKGAEALSLGKADHQGAVDAILTALGPHLAGRAVSGVGHRVVHGGPDYSAPVVVDADHLAALQALEPLAPLHQPHNLAAIRAAQTAFPAATQVACFDTAFHRGHSFVHDTFALPRRFYDQGVRRYGFHGLSYDYIAGCLARDWPELARGRVVVAHLGNGASLCAMKNGRSVGSSMGFTALDGVPMGTRPGQLDPGVLLYLLDHEGMDGQALTQLLYHESGLKGLSGISHDMRTLLESDAEAAREAVAHYVFRLRREIGAMSAVLGGLDALVFCGGVGEHARPIRAGVLEGMGYLGLALDSDANEAHGPVISSGSVPVLVIPTDEERVIARAVAAALT